MTERNFIQHQAIWPMSIQDKNKHYMKCDMANIDNFNYKRIYEHSETVRYRIVAFRYRITVHCNYYKKKKKKKKKKTLTLFIPLGHTGRRYKFCKISILHYRNLQVNNYMGQLMRLWHFLSSINSFFKRTCAAIQWD